MASSLADRVQRGWGIGRVQVARLSIVDLAPVLIASVILKLAISDGGRDPVSLTIAQVSVYATLTVVIWSGRHVVGNVGRAMLIMIGVIMLTSLTSVRLEASVREMLLWTMYLGIAIVTASTLDRPAAARRMLDLLAATAGWVVLIALFLFWGSGNPAMRWYATFYWPNPFAAFLLLVLPLEVVRLATARSAREALAHGGLTVLLTTAMVLTYSRGAWLTMLCVAPVALRLLRPPSWSTAALRLIIVGLLITGAVMFLTRPSTSPAGGQGVAARAASITDTNDLSVQGRVNFWHAAVLIFRDHPLLGTGAGSFGAAHPRYQRDVRFYARDAHNIYVQTLAEMGIPGAVALGLLLLAITRLWARSLGVTLGGDSHALVLGAGLGVLAFLIHSAIDMDWAFYANPAMAFALVGVMASYVRPRQDPHRARRSPAVAALALAMILVLAMHAAHRSYTAGYELARSGRFALALREYVTAAIRNPLAARYPAAASYAASRFPERYTLAVFYIRRAIALDRMNASYALQLADLLLQRAGDDAERLAEAEHWINVAIEADPLNRPEAYRLLAKMLVRQHRWDDADRVYRRALRLYLRHDLDEQFIHLLLWPQVVDLAIEAAELAAQMGDRRRAVGILQDVLARDPGNPGVKAVLTSLK